METADIIIEGAKKIFRQSLEKIDSEIQAEIVQIGRFEHMKRQERKEILVFRHK